MAEKKTNEILEAQQKARQDFLDLKKMQSGEMYAGPKPSETATVLKTPKEKFANFWHYSKWYVIFTIGITILIAVMVAQCVSKPNYDIKVVYFTYKPALDEQTALIADYLDDYVEDVSGNGKVEIQVINCSVTDSNKDASRTLTFSKIQSIMAAEHSVVLYVVDQKAIDYFNNALDYSIFVEEPTPLGVDFYKATEIGGTRLPDGLKVGLRIIKGTQFEGKDEADRAFEAGKQVLEKIKKQNS